MWDTLLVLGQIPGTNIQITFSELLLALELLFIGYLAYTHRAEIRREFWQLKKAVKIEIKSAKRIIRRHRLTLAKQLVPFKRKLHTKRIRQLRGVPAGKLHARQRIA
jgi:hypothetical protein